jgi:hypothetical protein
MVPSEYSFLAVIVLPTDAEVRAEMAQALEAEPSFIPASLEELADNDLFA